MTFDSSHPNQYALQFINNYMLPTYICMLRPPNHNSLFRMHSTHTSLLIDDDDDNDSDYNPPHTSRLNLCAKSNAKRPHLVHGGAVFTLTHAQQQY